MKRRNSVDIDEEDHDSEDDQEQNEIGEQDEDEAAEEDEIPDFLVRSDFKALATWESSLKLNEVGKGKFLRSVQTQEIIQTNLIEEIYF